MKNIIKAAGVFLTLIIVCLSFVGCKGNSNPIAGKWLVYKDSGGEAWVDSDSGYQLGWI